MWAKFKIIEPIEYIKGNLIAENIAEADNSVWSRQYHIDIKSSRLYNIIATRSKALGDNGLNIIEFPKTEDQGNMAEPPCTRLVTNIDEENCTIDFFYDNPEASVFFAKEGMVCMYHTEFDVCWSLVLRPFEACLIDATVPTRVSLAKKLILQEWKRDFESVKRQFSPWLGDTSNDKEKSIIKTLDKMRLPSTQPVNVIEGNTVLYRKMPPVIVFDNKELDN